MSDETPMSDAQACEIARQMENHFRAFGQLHQVLEKALVAGSQVEQCNQMLDQLKPQVDNWLKREAELEASVHQLQVDYTASQRVIADDLTQRSAQVEATVADAKTRAQAIVVQLEQDFQATVFTKNEQLQALADKQASLEKTIAALETRKATLAKEFEALVSS